MMILKRCLQGITALILIVYSSIWLLSPSVFSHIISKNLSEQNLILADDSVIRFNPFLTQLSVHNLVITQNGNPALAIGTLKLQLALHQLMFERISIEEFYADDFFIAVEKTAAGLNIAGLATNNSANQETSTDTNTDGLSFPYTLTLPAFVLSNSNISLSVNGQPHSIRIDRFSLSSLSASQNFLSSDLALTTSVDGAKTTLTTGILYENETVSLTSNLSLKQYPLNKLKAHLIDAELEELTRLNGLLSIDIDQQLTFYKNVLNVNVNAIQLEQKDLALTISDYAIDIPLLTSALNGLTLELNTDTETTNKTLFSFDSFHLQADEQSTFIDHNLTPPLQRTFTIESLNIGALSNSKTDRSTPYDLTARSNKYEKLYINGKLKPFSKTPEYHLNGEIQEISLPSLSAYVKDVVQLELKSGQLNSNIKVSLIADKVSGNVDLLLKGLETSAADNNEIDVLKNNSTITLNTALSLLKDSHGNVNLSIPLSGSTNDPKFGVNSFVSLITKKAVMAATKNYLTQTFIPYANVLSVAMIAGDYMLKTRIEDLMYQPAQISPSQEQQSYLQQFILLMNDKPNVNVTICAISVPADIQNSVNSVITKAAQIDTLIELAKQRSYAFKDYILKNSDIASARLLLCAPKLDNKAEAKPRIRLSF